MNRNWLIVGGVVLVGALCCCLAALLGLFLFQFRAPVSTVAVTSVVQVTPAVTAPPPGTPRLPASPTAGAATAVVANTTPTPPAATAAVSTTPGAAATSAVTTTAATTIAAGGATTDTLQALEAAVIPASDLREEAMRLKGIPSIPITPSLTANDYPVGTDLPFFVLNGDTEVTFTITARLISKTANAYFFSDDSVNVNASAVQDLVNTFQTKIYPTDLNFFGNQWTPGVPGDPRLYILYAHGLGRSVAGYYSSADEYSRLAQPYSNQKDMFYINADVTAPGDPVLPSVLAHEFQHMIAWHRHRNEDTWMNEGSSVLAELLNGFSSDGFDSSFLDQPDTQLDAWADGGPGPDAAPHYGAGFLFMAYFLDRFGQQATTALESDQINGLRAVDDVLTQRGVTDKSTGKPVTSLDVFQDWTIANYLGDPNVADGRYAYHDYPNAPTVSSPTDTLSCPTGQQTATVHQYATNYYELDCSGRVTISFSGALTNVVVPTTAHSGRYAFWGTRNDESDTTLTHEFDLTGVKSATFKYWTWFAAEQNYDFVYLEASTDGQKTWKILKTPSGTDANSTGNNFGWGYTGNSGGGQDPQWLQESVDLTPYAGQKVALRFEYITDPAVTWSGVLVDDISIPEIDYATDFEQDDGGWQAQGFARIDNLLPQTFAVQVIHQGQTSADTSVAKLPLDAHNTGSLSFDLASGEKAILVVSGTTLFTTQTSDYQFEVK
jgi:immune inhibitor A